MAGVRKIDCPNFRKGRKGYKPEAVVIHITDGSEQSTIFTFTNPADQVSAHYLVTKKGDIIIFVEEEDTAWHAGKVVRPKWKLLKKGINPNLYTIGIEFEGMDDEMPTVIQSIIGAWLVSKICASWSIPLDQDHVVPHNWIRANKACPGKGIQVGCLIWLAQILGKE